jgi:hypothetical protein
MSTSLHAMLSGSFTSNGLARFIPLPSGYDNFELHNITDLAVPAAANTNVMHARGTSLMPAGMGYVSLKTNGAATVALEVPLAAGGFTFVPDTGNQTPGAAVAVTAITAASPAVVSSASTAIVGDILRLTGTTGMLQVGGWDFTVSAVNPGVTQSINNLVAAGFGAAATAGFARIIPFQPRFYPVNRRITCVTAGASTVIGLNVTHFFTVGQKVRILVPAGWGMTEINGLIGTITATGTAVSTNVNTITVDIDSSAFTAFAFPTSAVAALGTGVPEVVPVGEAAVVPYQNLLDDATQNVSRSGVIIGTAVQTTGVLYQWLARRGNTV